MEFRWWLEGLSADPRAWLFPSPKGLPWGAQNYLNRVLKPAAIRARVGLFKRKTRKGEEVESTDVNFQVLRRTCATLFGAKAKDPGTRKHNCGTPIRRLPFGIINNQFQKAFELLPLLWSRS